MTEADWNNCTDPETMLEFLEASGTSSRRKLRLFACACCRRIWHTLDDDRSQIAVEVAECLADEKAASEDVSGVAAAALAAVWNVPKCAATVALMRPRRAAYRALGTGRRYRARNARNVASDAAGASAWCSNSEWREAVQAETRSQVALLHEIFGSRPLQAVAIASCVGTCNDGIVVRLAQSAYDERLLPEGTLDVSRLAILADALEEAGCTDAELLGHLRGPGPHVRGCYAIDAILGKS